MDNLPTKLESLDGEYKNMSKKAEVSAQAVKDFADTVRIVNVSGLYHALAEATATAVEATERVAAEAISAKDAIGKITTLIKAIVQDAI